MGILWICFTLAGSSGLIYEILWSRKLGFIFGSTEFALSVGLTVYLTGLALGSYFGGRTVVPTNRPGRDFGAMQLAIGVLGLLSLPLLDAGEAAYAVFKPIAFLVVGLALLPPTFLMGACLPVLIRLTPGRSSLISTAGRFYAGNTLGAVAGAALGAFVLLPNWGLLGTAAAASAVSFALALILWKCVGEIESPARVPAPAASLPSVPMPVVSTAIAVSGFSALLDEVIWTRSLEPVTGSSTWAFGIMLIPLLFGMALGIAAGTRLAAATSILRRIRPIAMLAWALTLTGITVFLGMFILHLLPGWFSELYADLADQPGWFLASQALVCGSICLIPSFWMGAVFPLTLAVSSNRSAPAEIVGRLYSLNTAGAIAGACLAGLLVIPWLGLHGGFLLSASLDLAMAATLLIGAPGQWHARLLTGAIPIALAGMMVYTAPPWDRAIMATGVNYLAPSIYANGQGLLSVLFRETRILDYREGPTGTVTVAMRGPVQVLSIDGFAEASTGSAAQILLPHYAMSTGLEKRRALVIGYGSGNTAGSLALYPLTEIDVAEIEPATLEAGRFFDATNHRPDRDPRVHIQIADGRAFLAASPRGAYDVIVSHPSMPWTPGSAKLFTREFFLLARTRLRSGGVLAQSFPLYNLEFSAVQSLLRTFAEAFPQVLVCTSGRAAGELLLLGSDRPLKLDWNSMKQLFATPERAADLHRALLPDEGSMAGYLLFGTAEIPAVTAQAPLNTDDNGRIEFASLADLYHDARDENVDRILEFAVDARRYLTGAPAETSRDARNRMLLELATSSAALRDFRRGLAYSQELARNDDSYASRLIAGDILHGLRRNPEAVTNWRRCLELQPEDSAALLRLVQYYQPLWPRDRPPEFDAWARALAEKSTGPKILVPREYLNSLGEPETRNVSPH
jgi:predicted membrane-bound spermidine synthase